MKARHQALDLGPMIVLTALCSLWLLLPLTAVAQTPKLQRLEVVVWPEYDQPAALVMLRGHLPLDTRLPAVVPLPMPISVAAPNAVAKRGPDGTLLLASYTLEEQGGWKIINVETDLLEIRLEYYDALAVDNADRRFTFQWPGGLEIGEVSYEVQQPIGAIDLMITPPVSSQKTGFDGLTYLVGNLGPISATDSFFVELAYTRTSPGLTIASLQPTAPQAGQPPQPATPPGQTLPVQPESSDNSVWLVVIPIVLLGGIVVIWFAISNPSSKKN